MFCHIIGTLYILPKPVASRHWDFPVYEGVELEKEFVDLVNFIEWVVEGKKSVLAVVHKVKNEGWKVKAIAYPFFAP